MSKTSKIIGLDLDGVIIDHTKNRVRLAEKLGFSLAPEETVTDIVKKKLPKDTYDTIKNLIYDDPTIGVSSPFMHGAEKGLKYLHEHGIPYYVISRRDPYDMAIQLLKKLGRWPSYFNEKNTFFVKTKEDKNNKARELGVTIYLDDQPSVLDALVDVPQKLLFDPLYAYAKRPEYTQYSKIHSWDKFIQVVKNL